MRITLNKHLCQIGNRWRLEDHANRHIDPKRIVQPVGKHCRLNRVPAKCKEALINANAIQIQHLTPYISQRLLKQCARRNVCRMAGAHMVWRWQGPSINLAIRRQR